MTTTKTPNNAIVVSQVKGNLVKDISEVFTSNRGKEYCTAVIACNNINRNPDDTWYPKVYFFDSCISFAKDLKQGDFIEITRALLNPGEIQDLWTDKAGNQRAQSSALMVMPVNTENGRVIPVKLIKKKEVSSTKPKVETQTEMFDKAVRAEVSTMEQEIVAEIVA